MPTVLLVLGLFCNILLFICLLNRALAFLANNFDGVVQKMTLTEEDDKLLVMINRELKTYIDNMEVSKWVYNQWGRYFRKERKGNVLFNNALNTIYLQLYGVRHMVKDLQIVREETCCRHMGYSFWLTARVLLYAPSHRQDNTYHTSRGGLAYILDKARDVAPW